MPHIFINDYIFIDHQDHAILSLLIVLNFVVITWTMYGTATLKLLQRALLVCFLKALSNGREGERERGVKALGQMERKMEREGEESSIDFLNDSLYLSKDARRYVDVDITQHYFSYVGTYVRCASWVRQGEGPDMSVSIRI